MRKFFVLLLACMFVAGAASAGMAIVQINEANFPDAVFRGYVSKNFDTDKDGILSNNEILNAKGVYVSYSGVKSLQGIKFLTSLQSLNCDSNKITELDLSGLASLKSLNCRYNAITSLNLTGCSSLSSFNCGNNKLTSLSLKDCVSLKSLDCSSNAITELDLSSCPEIDYIYCPNNKLTSINVKKCPELDALHTHNNLLSALDVSGNTKLQQLECQNNRITSLNVSGNTNIWRFYCDHNCLIMLDVSGNTSLNTNFTSTYKCSPQNIDGLTVSPSGGKYTVSLSDYLSANVKNVVASSVYGKDSDGGLLEAAYDSGTGIITFDAQPVSVYYDYDTKYSKNESSRYMGVTIAAGASPVITTSSLPAGTVNTPYSFTFTADGGKPITWTLEGDLPEGLTFENGTISGTPTAAGAFTLTVTAANDFDSATKAFTLTVSGATQSTSTTRWEIEDSKLIVETDGIPSRYEFSPLDGSDGHAFVISGDFPAGLTVHLPENWELHIWTDNDGSRITISDPSKTKTGDGSGVAPGTVRVFGENDITLNIPGIEMTAWYVGAPGRTETTKWEREDGKLIVETTAGGRYEFSPITSPDTHGDGFHIGGDFPAGLVIHLPYKWGIDIDTSYAVTVSDESKIIPHTEIPGLPDTAHRIMGGNAVTLNAADIAMTAFLFTAPAITTDARLGAFSADRDISIQLHAEGTEWTMTWTAENLPDVLSISDAGLITGSISAAGDYSFTVTATNCAGSDTRTFTLTAGTQAPGGTAPSITTESLPDGKAGSAYSVNLSADGTAPITWTAEGLPDGFTLGTSSGRLTGIPKLGGEYTLTVTASNMAGTDTRIFTLTVAATSKTTPPEITSDSLPEATQNSSYTAQLEAIGTGLTWSATGLPDGLEISAEGIISGTPQKSGTFRIVATVKNSAGVDSIALTLTVKSSQVPTNAPKITTRSLPEGFTGHDYTYQLEAEGTVDGWRIADEKQLPDGLDFDTSTGEISGTIRASKGSFKLRVYAVNEAGDSVAKVLTLKVSGKTPGFKTETLKAAKWNTKYRATIMLSNFSKATMWSITGDLPAGITFDKGKLSGKPEEVGEFSFTVTVSNGAVEITQDFDLTVNGIKPKLKGSLKSGAKEGQYYESTLTATGTTPIDWTVTNLPDGMSYRQDATGETCTVYGTPEKPFSDRVTFTLTNGTGEDGETERTMRLVVRAVKPKFATRAGEVPGGVVGQNYEFQLQLAEQPPEVEWSDDGNMPAGLYLDDYGLIYGRPETAGDFRFTVTAQHHTQSKLKATLRISMTITDGNGDIPSTDEPAPDIESESSQFVNGVAYYERGELTAGMTARIAGDGEIIAAILPALEVNEAGMYEFTVSLDVNVPVGGTLVWHSWPDGEDNPDDPDNVLFLDAEGETTETVPEDYTVTVNAWLVPGKVYEPVIAVRIRE